MITWPRTHCMAEPLSHRLNVWTGRSKEGNADELLNYSMLLESLAEREEKINQLGYFSEFSFESLSSF